MPGQNMPFEEVVEILRSLKKVEGVRVQINSEFWGLEYAAGATESTCKGVIHRWEKKSEKDNLYIKWDGYQRNQKAPLDTMDKDAAGDSLELKLLPGDDGKIPEKEDTAPAVEEEEEEEDDEPPPETIEVNEQKWNVETSSSAVRVDARTEPRTKPTLNSGGAKLDDIVKLFYFFLPPEWVQDIMKYTNPMLDEHDALHAKLTEGEVLRFFGYMLSLSIHTGTPIEKMWSKTQDPNATAPPPMMGRFGMSKNRFDKLRAIFCYGPTDDASFAANDWCFCEPMIEAFNAHMNKQIIPGWLLATDESMSAWRGKQGLKDYKKAPKVQWVPRKPEPLGCELKNLGDAESGVILFNEITKGKAEVIKPKFWTKENGATAATTLRLSENWFGTSRVIAGDSWFASVRTAEQLLLNGMHFVGDVKTGTKRFVPKQELERGTSRENGAWATWTSEVKLGGDKTVPIYAVSHRRGEAIHGFVATCGTTLPGHSHYAYFLDDEERAMGHIEEHELSRGCPKVLNDFTKAQPTIDRHNRYRQAILGMEKRLVTKNFSFRLFTTFLGMHVTNCFMWHRYANNQLADFKVELDKLALALMHNPKIEKPKPCSPHGGCRSPTGSADDDGGFHYLTKLKMIEGYDLKKDQQRCIICNAKTAWCCATCTQGPMALVPLCPEVTSPKKGDNKGFRIAHMCLCKHRSDPNFFPKGRLSGGRPKRARGSPERDEIPSEDEDGL